MTTVVAWAGVDSRGTASLYLTSDSRLTINGTSHWDGRQKLFYSKTRPLAVAYVGDAVITPPLVVQLIHEIDEGVLSVTPDEAGITAIASAMEARLPPASAKGLGPFTLAFIARRGDGLLADFSVITVAFETSAGPILTRKSIPTQSDLIIALGSGEASFMRSYYRWRQSDVGGTSRAIYSSFVDAIGSGEDQASAPPPQLVALYRVGPAHPLGVVHSGGRYLLGAELGDDAIGAPLQWHNDLFEIADPATLTKRPDAQPQPRPNSLR